MCAAAQYAALTQHTNAVSSLLGGNTVQNAPFDLRSISSSINHFQSQSIRQTILNEKLSPSPVSPVTSTSRTITSPKNHSPSSTGSSSIPPNSLNNKQKTFACPECGKVFNAHYNLTRHMPVHTGARPFICKICGKGFRQASTLWWVFFEKLLKKCLQETNPSQSVSRTVDIKSSIQRRNRTSVQPAAKHSIDLQRWTLTSVSIMDTSHINANIVEKVRAIITTPYQNKIPTLIPTKSLKSV